MSGIIGVDQNQKSGIVGGTWEYRKHKLYTRLFQTAAGDVAYTGVGFKPSLLHIVASSQDVTSRSWGMDDGTTHLCNFVQYTAHTSGTPGANTSNESIYVHLTATTGQRAHVISMDSDGFTLRWTHIGSPGTATMAIMVTAFR